MTVFHVYLNGKKVSTGGIGDTGVLSAGVTWVRRKGAMTLTKKPKSVEEELRLYLGGLITPRDEHVDWIACDLKHGDDVRIVVAKGGKIDPPGRRRRPNRAKERRAEKQYVKDMAKRFGWEIRTKRDKG